MDPIPGNGFFLVGPDISSGLYQTGGSASTFEVWINDVPRTGLDVRVVYIVQHARYEQGQCGRDEYVHRTDVREHQYDGHGL